MTEGHLPVAEPEPAPGPGPARDRTMVVMAVVLGVLFLTVAVVVPVAVTQYREAATPTLDDVQVLEDLRNDHVRREVDYGSTPPAGGPHDGAWLQCGVYDEQPRTENVVHSLEHGTVWVTYEPGLGETELEALAAQLPARGILSPYPGQDAPVVVTVWERQLELDGADDDRLALFLAEYGDGHTAPEPFASCEGGVRLAEDGGGPGVQA